MLGNFWIYYVFAFIRFLCCCYCVFFKRLSQGLNRVRKDRDIIVFVWLNQS